MAPIYRPLYRSNAAIGAWLFQLEPMPTQKQTQTQAQTPARKRKRDDDDDDDDDVPSPPVTNPIIQTCESPGSQSAELRAVYLGLDRIRGPRLAYFDDDRKPRHPSSSTPCSSRACLPRLAAARGPNPHVRRPRGTRHRRTRMREEPRLGSPLELGRPLPPPGPLPRAAYAPAYAPQTVETSPSAQSTTPCKVPYFPRTVPSPATSTTASSSTSLASTPTP